MPGPRTTRGGDSDAPDGQGGAGGRGGQGDGPIRLSNPGPGLPPGGLDRFGSPLDVAHAALYLVSDEACWVTGQVLAVDGGDEALTFTVAERNELGLKP